MIQLKDFKKNLYINADTYWRSVQKDKVVVAGFTLKVGSRLRASVSVKGVLRKFYMVVISLDPAVIAYWVEGEYGIYLEKVDFNKLLKKRDIDKRSMKDAALHPQNFREFSTKVLMSSEVRTLLWHLPRLNAKDVKLTPNAMILTTPQLIYDFSSYVTAGKENIQEWLFVLAEKAKTFYHTGSKQSELTDSQYDELKDFLVTLDSKRAAKLESPGAEVPTAVKKKVTLDYPMGSLSKIKPNGSSTQEFLKESKDTSYVLSDKLDGLSLQLKYVEGSLKQVTTRGNGTIGQDVTRHASSITSIPSRLPTGYKKGVYNVRAEAILSNTDFESLKGAIKDNNGKEYANPRNMLAGIVNRNVSSTKILSKANVVCYALMSHELTMDKSTQLSTLKEMGFHVVPYKVLKAKGVIESELTEYITQRKLKGDFDLDGAVIECNSAKIRNTLGNSTNSLNPRYARAFKVGDTERVEARVEEVIWQVSKHGKLKPKIRIKPIKLGGVTVRHATAFNASFVFENKLGPGAKVLLTRSGDVIPHIISVTVKANKASMPDASVVGNYDWNSTEVDLVLSDAGSNETVQIKQITSFFTRLGVDYLGSGIVAKLYEAGIDTIDKVINTSIPELMNIDGIQKKSAEKLYTGIISAVQRVDLPTLASATPFFGDGFGKRRLDAIYAVYKDEMFSCWDDHTIGEVASKIAEIHGFSTSTAKQFAKGIKPFNKFLKRNSGRIKVQKKKEIVKSSAKLEGVSVCWTGIRDSLGERVLTENGGVVSNSVKEGLTYLVCKDPSSTSSKSEKAKSLGVKVITVEQFNSMLAKKGVTK